MLSLKLLRYRFLLPLLFLAGVLLSSPASASRIEYDIVSLQDTGMSPFSGLFASNDDDDGLEILSGDLRGLLAFSTVSGDLFLDGQELRVETFLLTGTARICGTCVERAIEVALDSDSVSVLELSDGVLRGSVDVELTMEGYREELTLTATGATSDPDLNSATPQFVSLFLGLDAGLLDFGRDDGKKAGSKGDDDGQLYLQAQGPVVPEPGTFVLLAGGLLGLAFVGRRHPERATSRTGRRELRRPPVD